MYRRVLAFDYDGTIAECGRIPQSMLDTLLNLRRAKYSLFLVTGRNYRSLPLNPLQEIFDGIVWENGAVLSRQGASDIFLPFGQLDPNLISSLRKTGIPLEQGESIVSSWSFHEQIIWQSLTEYGGEATVSHNKGAVMILPPGANKGSGLERMLRICGLSPRNLVCFGDGENDLSMFQLAETRVAVGDAVDELKAAADFVTTAPGPQGVLEALHRFWINDRVPSIVARPEREIAIGYDAAGQSIDIPGQMLAGRRIGIFGDSGSGKSWLTGLLVEGMHRLGYQVLVIDPEGDHRNLSSLPGFIALTGSESVLTNPAIVPTLIEESSISIVVDLSSYSVAERAPFIATIMTMLHPLRANKYRPHWVILEEAQHFLPLTLGSVERAVHPMINQGGLAFVSYRPDRLSRAIRDRLDHLLVARLQDREAYGAISTTPGLPSASELAATPQGSFWLSGRRVVRLKTGARRVPHVRHLYKYLDRQLPLHRRFYFCVNNGYIGISAGSLFEFMESLKTIPIESIEYHHCRGDFVRWARSSLGDEGLAGHLEKLMHRHTLTDEVLRVAILQHVSERYHTVHQTQ